MRPPVAELVPTAKIVQHPRLSRLASSGMGKLSRLPPRSAAKLFVECMVRLDDKLGLMPEVFDDLAEVHRVAGVTDGPAEETPQAQPEAPSPA